MIEEGTSSPWTWHFARTYRTPPSGRGNYGPGSPIDPHSCLEAQKKRKGVIFCITDSLSTDSGQLGVIGIYLACRGKVHRRDGIGQTPSGSSLPSRRL